jgi:hypothetical protein
MPSLSQHRSQLLLVLEGQFRQAVAAVLVTAAMEVAIQVRLVEILS